MSDASEPPKPSKLKLSSSKTQPDTPQSAPIASTETTPRLQPRLQPQLTPKVSLKVTPKEAPKAADQQRPATKTSPIPPPLARKTAPRATKPTPRKAETPAKPIPSAPAKDDPLGSILIVGALLLILAAAAGGIWYLLRSDEPASSDAEVTDAEVIPLKPSPTNPVERAKATIATVPDRTLDQLYELKSEETTESVEVSTPAETQSEPQKPQQPKTNKKAVSEFLQNLHIGGVRTGAKARIMLDGENYNISDTVDETTGLKFIGTRDKKLLFKDSNGIVYVKSF